MKPDWETLMAEYKDHATILVADVDCTAGGQSLCQDVGVQGYPTIKFGDPDSMEDYQGGRDLSALKAHAAGLKPNCSPKNLDICTDEQKAEIEKFMKMPKADLEKAIKEANDRIDKLEQDFKDLLTGLQNQYKEASEKKDKEIAEIKASGLGRMKSILKARQSEGAEAAEEL